MDAGVDERAAGREHARGFAERRARVVEVGVRQQRDDGWKGCIFEWELVRVGLQQLGADGGALTCERELVVRRVDARYRPPRGGEERQREAGPAGEIETTARAFAEQLDRPLAKTDE